jgi:hypothetical protein
MTNRKQLICVATIVAGCVFFLPEHSARAQWQPVIHTSGCPFAYQPVCANRKRVLVTYANACTARSALARIVSDGVCPENCPSIYKPVCAHGADGKRRTYANACAAKNDNAQIIRNTRCLLPSR